MLTEQRRQQLDGIVQDMVANKESDSTVRFVVDDFKKKYAFEAETEKKKKNTLLDNPITRGIQKVFPGKRVGESIGTLAGLGISKAQGTSEFFDTSAPSPAQVAGDVAGGGLTLASLGGAGVVGTFGARLLKTMGLGAGLSASQSVAEGGTVKDITKSALAGGAVGAALPIAGATLHAFGKQIEQLPARFVNSALSRNKAQVLQDIAKDKTDDLAKFVIEKKPIGTAKQLISDSSNSIKKLNDEINTALAESSRATGGVATVGRDNFLDEIVKIPEARGALLKRAEVKGIVERLAPQTRQLLQKPSLTVEEANKLRQLLDRTLGDRAFLGGQLSHEKVILKKFADSLREAVKTKAPEGTRKLFSELANEIRFRDGLLNKVAQREGNQVLSFGDFIGGGLGGVFGGGIPGAIGGIAARRAIESVPLKIGSAKAINALTKAAPVLDQLAPAQQTVILNLFSELFSPDENESRPE